MIEIKNLSKFYGTNQAVKNISFTVEKGEIVGFLGPNGAGKTTTMNIITGYISATDGTVTVDGFDISKNPKECKKRIGYLPEQPPLYLDMKVREYLDFVFDIKGVKDNKKDHIDAVVQLVKVEKMQNRLIKNLSKGYRQRVGIAQALIGNPEILILDEPTVGLDPKQIIEIRNVIKELGQDRTVILSSHILPEISAICEKVIVINEGRLMAMGTPEELSSAISEDNQFTVRVSGEKGPISAVIKGVSGVVRVDLLGQTEPGAYDFLVESEPGTDLRKTVFAALARNDMPLLMLKPANLTLEEIFLRLTGENAVSLIPDEPEAQDALEGGAEGSAQDPSEQPEGGQEPQPEGDQEPQPEDGGQTQPEDGEQPQPQTGHADAAGIDAQSETGEVENQ